MNDTKINGICIYTGLTDTETTFNSKEHIFPKGIGGIYCLPNGCVSDEVNIKLSTLEMEFMRENPQRYYQNV